MKVLLKQKLFLVNVTLFLLLTSCETSPGSEVARSPRDLKVDVRHDFYDVEGSTVKELLDAMLERGPKEDGKSFFGYAKWYVNWRFWYASKGNDCEMTKVMVS
ncbi:DUF922 domain-containing Zn-dependent protease, partial [candidate division KSB1 bacterium]|nr:DUF922 domain-containing Zn-dependent protease [candidate division KSB1 bacterium]NIR72339.1 DUF922 domain-containing Zn-dependent protease [candidate division KSB1 bacterium]NIS25045.1 DUF922 domain-containing Zn-dependent protease [candidate division KSB1 bacterium]NIT71966.1 DUF922 domain-containing Zn-dependent protease [candidate division KSB1 bacterium]NIU25722.1 DUF922 domain-containing Zn-dependent protease [candidate division KSB1 bacterium]